MVKILFPIPIEASQPMSKSFPDKTKPILIVSLLLLTAVSIGFNKFNVPEEDSVLSPNGAADENGNFYKPPIDAEDEADRFIQQASENYFYHEFGKGAENYRRAIAIFEARDDFLRVAKTYESLGDLYKFAHNVEDAEASYLQAADFHTTNQNLVGKAMSLKKVGDLYMEIDQIETAGDWYQKSGQAVKNVSPSRDLAKIYEAIGYFHWKLNKFLPAEENFSLALKAFAAIKDPMGYDHMANILAMVKKKRKSAALAQQ
jgi:tetratricopeptide (TPR) repeat protein